jgi:hypothetical protein
MNKTQEFRQHHIRRAYRALKAEGVPSPSIEIKLPSGAVLTAGTGALTGSPAVATPPKATRKTKAQPSNRRQP